MTGTSALRLQSMQASGNSDGFAQVRPLSMLTQLFPKAGIAPAKDDVGVDPVGRQEWKKSFVAALGRAFAGSENISAASPPPEDVTGQGGDCRDDDDDDDDDNDNDIDVHIQ